MMYFWFSI